MDCPLCHENTLLRTCFKCNRDRCEKCQPECKDCCIPLCLDHMHRCVTCQRWICTGCMVICKLCDQDSCGNCSHKDYNIHTKCWDRARKQAIALFQASLSK